MAALPPVHLSKNETENSISIQLQKRFPERYKLTLEQSLNLSDVLTNPKNANHERFLLALEWVEEAAAFGNVSAQILLALFHIRGKYLAQDICRAVFWLNQAKAHGSAEAIVYFRNLQTNFPNADFQINQDFLVKRALQNFMVELQTLSNENNAKPLFSKIFTLSLKSFVYGLYGGVSNKPKLEFELAMRLREPIGTEQDLSLYYKMLRISAEEGYVFAQMILADEYTEDYQSRFKANFQKNNKLAFKWYLAAAKQGNSLAELWVSDCYFYGKGVGNDGVNGLKWLQISAAHNNASAQYKLFLLCQQQGLNAIAGFRPFDWLQKAAENTKPNAFAQFFMGDSYEYGKMGLTINLNLAYFWYNIAALQDNPYAKNALLRLQALHAEKPELLKSWSAFAFAKARSEPNKIKISSPDDDFNSAVPYTDWLACSGLINTENNENNTSKYKVGEQDLVSLRHALALSVLESNTLTLLSPWEDPEIYTWVEEAAAMGIPDAQFHLAKVHRESNTYYEDPERVLFWLNKAIQGGSKDALKYREFIKNVSPEYLQDSKGELLVETALKSYHEDLVKVRGSKLTQPLFSEKMLMALHIHCSEPDAQPKYQFELAIRYSKGIGCKRSIPSFYVWLQLAANKDYPYAQLVLGNCLSTHKVLKDYPRDTTILPLDDRAAFLYYQKASGKDPSALHQLAHCYLDGRGTQKNTQLGLDFQIKAAEFGLSDAQWNLYNYYTYGMFDVPKNDNAGNRWLIKAAENLEPSPSAANAQYTLGNIYELGTTAGFKKNLSLAYYWYNKAALLNDTSAQDTLRRLQETCLKDIPQWAKLAALKTAASNAIAKYRDWLIENIRAIKPSLNSADRLDQKARNKKGNLVQAALKQSKKAQSKKEADINSSSKMKTTDRKSAEDNANTSHSSSFNPRLRKKDAKSEAQLEKLKEEKRVAELKEKCNGLYADIFSVSNSFHEVTGLNLETLSKEVFAQKDKIDVLLKSNEAILQPIEEHGLTGAKKNIQRQARAARESNKDRKIKAKELYDNFFKIYEGQNQKNNISSGSNSSNNSNSSNGSNSSNSSNSSNGSNKDADDKNKKFNNDSQNNISNTMATGLKEAIARFRNTFEETQKDLPSVLKKNDLEKMKLLLQNLHNCQNECEQIIRELNEILRAMDVLVSALEKQQEDFNSQKTIAETSALSAAEEKEKVEKLNREVQLLESIQADARKQQENQEREENARRLIEKRAKWFAKTAEIQKEKIAQLAKIRELKRAEKEAREAREAERKIKEAAFEKTDNTSLTIKSEEEVSKRNEENIENEVNIKNAEIKNSKSEIKDTKDSRDTRDTPNLGTIISSQLETIKTRSSIQGFLANFRNMIQNEQQFTFQKENRDLEGYALLGKLCPLLVGMCEDKGLMGFLAREVRNTLFHGDPKLIDPYYPREIAEQASISQNTQTSSLTGIQTSPQKSTAPKKVSINERFVEMNLTLLEINWNSIKDIEKVVLPEDFARFAFYPRKLKLNEKIDFSQITAKELYALIQAYDKEKKEKKEAINNNKRTNNEPPEKELSKKENSEKEVTETKQKLPRPNIKECEERYKFYRDKRNALQSKATPHNGEVMKSAIGHLEGLAGSYAQYVLDAANSGDISAKNSFLQSDPECRGIIQRGRDFRHNQVQLQVQPAAISPTLPPSSNGQSQAIGPATSGTISDPSTVANTQPTANKRNLKKSKNLLRKPYVASPHSRAATDHNLGMVIPYYSYPIPMISSHISVYPLQTPLHQPALLFSTPTTTFAQTATANTLAAATYTQVAAPYAAVPVSYPATSMAASAPITTAYSTKQAAIPHHDACSGPTKSKVLITYYHNNITHINYGQNNKDANKLFQCLKSTERDLDLKMLTIGNEAIIEIPVSKVQFGGRKGFISQSLFDIEEVELDISSTAKAQNPS